MNFDDYFKKPEPEHHPVYVVNAGDAGRYAATAMANELEAVASAVEGTRNDTLNISALKLFRLAEGGHLEEATVAEALGQAALGTGLDETEIRATLRSAREAARGQPRRVPESNGTLAITGGSSLAVPAADAAISAPKEPTPAYVLGGAFILDVPDTIPAIWGAGNDVYWAEGESLIIAGPQGVGKTTLAIQLIRARLGLSPGKILGQPVQPGGRVLWLAMDRPAQARRAARRHFAEADRDVLNDRLAVWQGPPPGDVAKHTGLLTHLAEQAGADTLIIDSVKDAAIGLSDDTVGAGYNRARQTALTAGIQIVELHHQVKRGAQGGAPNTLADLYGSVWIPAGAGSVLLLWGEAGDPIVSMRHLKQPMNEIGPLQLTHNHDTGTTTIVEGVDLIDLVRYAHAEGLTAKEAAVRLFETSKPTEAQVEKMRRRLNKLVDAHLLTRVDGARGGAPSRYYLGATDLTMEGQ